MKPIKGSVAGQLKKEDVLKTVRTFALVAVAAGLGWLLENIADLNLGQWQVIAVAGLTTVLDLVRRLGKDNQRVDPPMT